MSQKPSNLTARNISWWRTNTAKFGPKYHLRLLQVSIESLLMHTSSRKVVSISVLQCIQTSVGKSRIVRRFGLNGSTCNGINRPESIVKPYRPESLVQVSGSHQHPHRYQPPAHPFQRMKILLRRTNSHATIRIFLKSSSYAS